MSDRHALVDRLKGDLWANVNRFQRLDVLSVCHAAAGRAPQLVQDFELLDALDALPGAISDEETINRVREILDESHPDRWHDTCRVLGLDPVGPKAPRRSPRPRRVSGTSRRARIRARENARIPTGLLRRMPFFARRAPEWWDDDKKLEYTDTYGQVTIAGLWPKPAHLRLLTGVATIAQLNKTDTTTVRCSLGDLALASFHEEDVRPGLRGWIRQALIDFAGAHIEMTAKPDDGHTARGGRLNVPCSPIVAVNGVSADTGEWLPLKQLLSEGRPLAPVDQPIEVTLADWFVDYTSGEKARRGTSYMLVDRAELKALPARVVSTWSTVITLKADKGREGRREVLKRMFYLSPAMAPMFGRFQHISAAAGHIDHAEPRRIERDVREDLELLAGISKSIGQTTWGMGKRPNGYLYFWVQVPQDIAKKRLHGLHDPNSKPSQAPSRVAFRSWLSQTTKAKQIYGHMLVSLRWRTVTRLSPRKPASSTTRGGHGDDPAAIRRVLEETFTDAAGSPTRAGPGADLPF